MLSNSCGKHSMKRKRVVLPIETKLQIVERVMNGEAFTKLSSEYGIGAQTCRDIFNNRDKLVNFAFSSGTVGACLKRKTLRKANFHDIDKAVYQWFQQQRSEGLPITGPMLIEKALWFHKEMKIDEPFSASSGWLAKFKARYNIRQPKTKDEKLIAHEPLIDKFKTEFKKIVKKNNFTLDQIYLADEKVLHCNYLGSREKESETELLVKESNHKIIKNESLKNDCVTVMACANANGSKKLKLFCTGNHKFINENNSSSVNYYSVNKDKDSYKKVLHDWFNMVFIPEVKEDLNEKSLTEQALLIVKNADNIVSENEVNENDIQITSENNNFFIMFLPKIISELPRMSLSSNNIIKHYIQSILIPMIEDCNYIKNENCSNNNISLSETFSVISDAWHNIKDEHMQHSSWWWHNLFTEMEKEGIIELREGITTHFMTLLDSMITDQDESLLFTNTIDNTKTGIEESQTNLDKDNLDLQQIQYQNSHFETIINNIKTEVKEEVGEGQTNFDESNFDLKQDQDKSSHFTALIECIKTEVEDKTNLTENNVDFQTNYSFQNNTAEFDNVLKDEKCRGTFSPFDESIFKIQDNNVSCSQSKFVTTSDAISCTDMLLQYLEQQSDSSYNDILVVKNIRKKLKDNLRINLVNGR